ncbi:MAG: porin family protein [Candidatus Krumholzibacteriia bacterium]
MKRALLLTLATLALAAATASAGLLPTYGMKAGLNISDVNMQDIESSTKSGYVAGLYVDMASPLLHLQAELLYTSRKSELGALNPSDYNVEVRNHYLQVPVVIKFGLPIPMVSPSVYAGPAVALPIKSEFTDRGGDWVDVKDYNKDLVWSVVLGADVKLFDKLIVDIRYDIAVTALNDVPVGDILDDINDEFTDAERYRDLKDRTFSVMAGFQF